MSQKKETKKGLLFIALIQVLLTGIRIRNRNKKYLRTLPVARARQFYYSFFSRTVVFSVSFF